MLGPSSAIVSQRFGCSADERKFDRIVLTTEPGGQLDVTDFLDGNLIVKGGAVCPLRGALCLGTLHFPERPRHPEFPRTVLRPGKVYETMTVFTFSTR